MASCQQTLARLERGEGGGHAGEADQQELLHTVATHASANLKSGASRLLNILHFLNDLKKKQSQTNKQKTLARTWAQHGL